MNQGLCQFLLKLGTNLSTIRKLKHVSQEQLALTASISLNYISQLERGMSNPSMKQLHKICRCLHIKLYDLLKDTE